MNGKTSARLGRGQGERSLGAVRVGEGYWVYMVRVVLGERF